MGEGREYPYCTVPSGKLYRENNMIQIFFVDVVFFLIPTGLMMFSYISIGKSLYKSIKENMQLSGTGGDERYRNIQTNTGALSLIHYTPCRKIGRF